MGCLWFSDLVLDLGLAVQDGLVLMGLLGFVEDLGRCFVLCGFGRVGMVGGLGVCMKKTLGWVEVGGIGCEVWDAPVLVPWRRAI